MSEEIKWTYITYDRPKLLKNGDKVIFTVDGKSYDYTVDSEYLAHSKGDNSTIFGVLGISKKETAENCYGYPPTSGEYGYNWPEYKKDDYAAATRLVNRLYSIIDARSHGAKMAGGRIKANPCQQKINTLFADVAYKCWISGQGMVREEFADIGDIIPINFNSNLNQLKNGNIIKTSTVTPTIIRGEERTGCTISGKTGRSTIRVGYLSNQPVSC